MVFHEKDEQFIVGIFKSASGKYIFISAVSSLTSEVWVLSGSESISGILILNLYNSCNLVSKERI